MSMINVRTQGAKGAYTPYGGCLEAMECKDHQMFLYGGTGSGKTTALCHKMMLLCMLYPGVKFLFTRKSYRALIKSGVETFERVLRQHGWDITNKPHPYKIHKLGETEPREFRFPFAKRVAPKDDDPAHVYSGVSRVVLTSLDKVYDEMGSEYDYIYVNQPEEISEEDWQFLISRANGRRDVAPYPQLMGDPNPQHEKHWIKLGGYEFENGQQIGVGDRWRLIKSIYTDNPTIWDPKLQCYTRLGEELMKRLEQSLNPVMARRLIAGEWCSFEGLVYGEVWNRAKHIIPRAEYDITNWKRYWAIDFGYTDPFVCLMFAKHPEQNIYVCYREIFMTGRTIYEHAAAIQDATIGEPRPELIIADRNPESIQVLINALGLNIISAKKGAGSVRSGVNIMIDMIQNDQLLYMEDALFEEDQTLMQEKRAHSFVQEIENYRWDPNKMGEQVIAVDDHALDAARYLFTHLKATNRIVPFVWE